MPDQALRVIANVDLPQPYRSMVEDDLDSAGLDRSVLNQASKGPFATIEWFAPTALVVIILQPYFKAFLDELGRDHYKKLKTGLVSLGKRFFGSQPEIPVTTVTSTNAPQKARPINRSIAFSFTLKTTAGIAIKFTFPREVTAVGLELAVELILAIAQERETIEQAILPNGVHLEDASHFNTVFIHWDASRCVFRVIDPLTGNPLQDDQSG